MADQRFLGSGMKFPPQVDPGTGRFVVSHHEQSVREAVYLILMTNRTERWLEPKFGSQMMSYAFMDTSTTTLRMLSDNIQDMILEQEPRISDVNVNIDAESKPGCLIIFINYTVAASNSKENFVFPFYLNVSKEENLDEI